MAKAVTPHDDDAGILAVRKNPLTGKYVCVYLSEEQGLEVSRQTKYACVCSAHGNTIQHGNRLEIMRLARVPHEWCEDCADEKDNLTGLVEQIKASQGA